MSKPKAVLISDVHFNLNNLEPAAFALTQALNQANRLEIPLIIAGDLNDTKAIIRAEVAAKLIEILSTANVDVYILEGNHDKINEKGVGHGLEYLRPYATIIDEPQWIGKRSPYNAKSGPDSFFFAIPYLSDSHKLPEILKDIPKGATLVMHQGFLGAAMGDYIQDRSSVSPEAVKDYTVFSGHYHKHQTIGTITYIGSPYTITYGEANDGPKGYLVVNEDMTYSQRIVDVRKHIILNINIENLDQYVNDNLTALDLMGNDLVWVKLSGPQSLLKQVKKKTLGEKLFGHSNFKLDLVADSAEEVSTITNTMTIEQILDTLIDGLKEPTDHKTKLKSLWRSLL